MNIRTATQVQRISPTVSVAHIPAGAVPCPSHFIGGLSQAYRHALEAMYFAAAKTAWDRLDRQRATTRAASQN